MDVGTGGNKHTATFTVEKAFVGDPPVGSGYEAGLDESGKSKTKVTYVVILATGKAENKGETSVEAMVGWVQ
jgi:hypothetical protein